MRENKVIMSVGVIREITIIIIIIIIIIILEGEKRDERGKLIWK